jgi:hypothetical protein
VDGRHFRNCPRAKQQRRSLPEINIAIGLQQRWHRIVCAELRGQSCSPRRARGASAYSYDNCKREANPNYLHRLTYWTLG